MKHKTTTHTDLATPEPDVMIGDVSCSAQWVRGLQDAASKAVVVKSKSPAKKPVRVTNE